ncbi:MAG: YezD family protein [Sporomusaceae bacterium]|nr:YezD family protein [Sporomusaceae bacterium]
MLEKQNQISVKQLDQILAILQQVYHGHLTLTWQNFRLIQIERNEKIRPDESLGSFRKNSERSKEFKAVRKGLEEACEGIEYGQVTIVVKTGKVVQIDRTEKQRFTALAGLDGDGI